MKPFANLKPSLPLAPSTPAPWIGRSIATSKLRLLEHSAYVDYHSEHDSYHKHLFVHIGNPEFTDPILEVLYDMIKNNFIQIKGLFKGAELCNFYFSSKM